MREKFVSGPKWGLVTVTSHVFASIKGEIDMTTMFKRSAQVLAITALAFGLAACGKSEDKTAGQKLDSAISQTEKAAENAGTKIEEGTAKAGDAAADALAKAGEATGAAVDKAGEKMEEGAAKAGAALDDAGITAAVKTDLIKAPEISALQINVDTKAGAVTLTGTVPSEAVKTQAGDIAKAAKGVTSVNNNLTVKAG